MDEIKNILQVGNTILHFWFSSGLIIMIFLVIRTPNLAKDLFSDVKKWEYPFLIALSCAIAPAFLVIHIWKLITK